MIGSVFGDPNEERLQRAQAAAAGRQQEMMAARAAAGPQQLEGAMQAFAPANDLMRQMYGDSARFDLSQLAQASALPPEVLAQAQKAPKQPEQPSFIERLALTNPLTAPISLIGDLF